MEAALYDKAQKPNHNSTKTHVALINVEKNIISKSLHSNKIDKQRQKRDSDVDWTEQDNSYLGKFIFVCVLLVFIKDSYKN